MKKTLLLLFALVGGVVSSSADVLVEDITSRFAGGYVWDGDNETKTVNGDGTITYNAKKYGGLATWYGDSDLSGYKELVIEYSSNAPAWTQVLLMNTSDETIAKASASDGVYLLVCNLEGKDLTHIKQIAIQQTSSDDNCDIIISKVYFRSFDHSTTGIDIPFDEWGCILTSAFSGYTDYDKVVFTYTVTGYTSDYENWGSGAIKSRKGNYKVAALPLITGDGTYSYTCTVGDLKKALEDVEDQYGIQGISFETWSYGDPKTCITERQSVKLYRAVVNITFPAGKTLISYSPSTGVELDVTDVDGLTAYAVSSVTKTAVNLTETKGVYAGGHGYILEGTAGATYNIPVVASAPSAGTNLLNGTEDGTETVSANSVYVLSNGKFCLFTGTEIPAHKAYLKATEVPSSARDLEIVIDGLSTGIKNIKVGSEDNIYYDLSGRRVLYPTKGLYIVNGKKVVIK
ncbi:MAG: hypothetical protein IJV44_05090 [Prevotella sp.]|nr:hypothetical protein [Prevotella sp.]